MTKLKVRRLIHPARVLAVFDVDRKDLTSLRRGEGSLISKKTSKRKDERNRIGC